MSKPLFLRIFNDVSRNYFLMIPLSEMKSSKNTYLRADRVSNTLYIALNLQICIIIIISH